MKKERLRTNLEITLGKNVRFQTGQVWKYKPTGHRCANRPRKRLQEVFVGGTDITLPMPCSKDDDDE